MKGYGSYKVCQVCLSPIYRGAKIAYKKVNKYYAKEGKMFHASCLKRISNRQLTEIFSFK